MHIGKVRDVRASKGRESADFQPQGLRNNLSQSELTALVLDQQRIIIAEQILLRAVLKELVKRCADGRADPLGVVREIGGSLHNQIDSYEPGCGDSVVLEQAKEHARMNVDRVCSLFKTA